MMNKKDLVAYIAKKNNVTKTDAEKMVDMVVDGIHDAVVMNEGIQFIGQFTIQSKVREARKGHNPATGKSIMIPAKRVVKFKVGSKLADAVANFKAKKAKK